MMMNPPERTPAQPIPDMALPRIRAIEFGAAAQITEPTSKSPRAARYTQVTLNSAYSLPKVSWKLHIVSVKAEPYQAMSSRELNSAVILGIAVARMDLS